MRTLRFSPRAEQDLAAIWEHLATHAGEELADRIQSELLARCESLAAMPGQGTPRPELSLRPVRFVPVYSWLIVYRSSTPLEIVAVIHGRRDIRNALRSL